MLLIYLEKEKNVANRLISGLDKIGVPIEPLLVKSPEAGRRDIEKQFFAFFSSSLSKSPKANSPSHIIVLSSLAPGWVDFLAGFYCGSHLPIVIYGKENVECIPDVFNFCFKPLKTKDSLQSYIKTEWETYKKQEIARETKAARETLLKMGIPVNDESMVNCVNEGLLRELIFFLAAGFSPDTRSKAGVPLLCVAARNGNRELIRFLFFANAQIDLRSDDRGTTAFLDSVMGKHNILAKDLIKAGADVNVQSKGGQTALIVAVGSSDADMVETLLKAGADPEICDSMGVSARKYANIFQKSKIIVLFNDLAPLKTV